MGLGCVKEDVNSQQEKDAEEDRPLLVIGV